MLQSVGDADTDIVKAALLMSHRRKKVTVVASDTDILILLLYHYDMSMTDIYMQYDIVSKGGVKVSSVSIREIREKISDTPAPQLLYAHAISGCDSTSSLFRRGKVAIWRQLIANNKSRELTDIIGSSDKMHDEVLKAGLHLMSFIYRGKENESVNHLRYVRYMDILAFSLSPKPDKLPPTENAAKFHVYVSFWKTLGATTLIAEDWGWNVVNGCYTSYN